MKFNHQQASSKIQDFPERRVGDHRCTLANPASSPQHPISRLAITTPEGGERASIRRLRRSKLPIGTVELARFLVGKIVVRELPQGRLSGRIVETEAYPPGDPAAHHFRGPTARNRSMFLGRGHAYVYFTYGNHFMLNVSSEVPGVGGGVLLRALQPLEGLEHMQLLRGTVRLRDLARGPGRLAEALEIDRSVDGVDLCAPGPLWLGALAYSGGRRSTRLGESVRIGITRAAERLLRFYERGNPFVSGAARMHR
jgi:DNA-3-methyladenine glycosylase